MGLQITPIAKLKPGDRRVNVKFRVIRKLMEKNIFSRRNSSRHRIAEFLVKDDSGKIVLTLWDSKIKTVRVGGTYLLINGFVTEFKGERRLNAGRYGKLRRLRE